MEFRPRKPKLVIWALVVSIGTIFLALRVSELIQKPPFKLTYDLAFMTFIVLFGLIEIHSYFQNLGVVVIVNDMEIIKKKRSFSTTLKWSDIQYVNVVFVTRRFGFPRPILPYFWKESFIISLKSADTEIKIDSDITDIRNLIMMLKAKLGDIFDTKEIPVEFKYEPS